MPGTHFQSSDSAFHKCTWASTMVRLPCAVEAFDASAVVAATVDATNWRRDSMDVLPRYHHTSAGVAKESAAFSPAPQSVADLGDGAMGPPSGPTRPARRGNP